MTCLNCDSLQCVTVNRESYSWLIAAYCSQSPTFICPIVSFCFAQHSTSPLRTRVSRREISLGSFQKKKGRKIVYLSAFPCSSISRRYLVEGGEERKKKNRKDGKKQRRSVQKWTPIIRYHRFDEKFLFVIGGISPVYRYFTASPYYK